MQDSRTIYTPLNLLVLSLRGNNDVTRQQMDFPHHPPYTLYPAYIPVYLISKLFGNVNTININFSTYSSFKMELFVCNEIHIQTCQRMLEK